MKKAYDRLKNAIEEYKILEKLPENPDFDQHLYEKTAKAQQEFYRAMSNDFNTPEAFAALYGLVREMNILKDSAVKEGGISKKALASYKEAADTLYSITKEIFGFFDSLQPCVPLPEHETAKKEEKTDEELINMLIEIRNKARKEKNFELADYIRDTLKEKGIILEDTPVGTVWKKA
jgi:cysteinyl-tRNA synthetase